jgi:hypothetical protein
LCVEDVDGRDKPGHDEVDGLRSIRPPSLYLSNAAGADGNCRKSLQERGGGVSLSASLSNDAPA